MSDLVKLRSEIEEKLTQFKVESEKLQSTFENTLIELQRKGYKIDKDHIRDFMLRFWHTYPTKNPNEWEVAIPVFIPFNVGWFDRTEGGYNIFIVNKYTKWFGEAVPDFISKEITMPPAWNITVDGQTVKFPETLQEKVEDRFGKHLGIIDKDNATVKQGHEVDLIAEIIDSGSLPFVPHAVDADDLRESLFTQIWDELQEKYVKLELYSGKYSYEGEAIKLFKKYGAIGIYLLMSFGKTVIGARIYSEIKPREGMPHGVILPYRSLIEQWEQFFEKNCPSLMDEVKRATYQGLSRKGWKELQNTQFTVLGFDECHFLPAPIFSRLATLRAIYRFGNSATPYREDGKTAWIMALTGPPFAVEPKTVMNLLGKEYHQVNVHVVRDLESKFMLTKQLFNPERRTMFMVDLLAIGNRLASIFEIPFISGETKNRLEVMKENRSFVASRTFDFGISIKDLEHIIEVDFHHGSRSQQVSRTGRLIHSEAKNKVHDILFTRQELEDYGKRLGGLIEKGFRYKLIPHMTSVQLANSTEKEKKWTKTGKADFTILKELYQEGYFQRERSNAEVLKEIEKRGGKTTVTRTNTYMTRMTRRDQLFKIKTEDGNKFKQR